ILELLLKMSVNIGIRLGTALAVLAILDYFYQKYEYNKNLMMTKQEVKEEYKQTEGDPKIKSKIREKQRAMSMRRMMHDVPKADVIITNPIHFAVAIEYNPEHFDAPKVIAKGRELVAKNIKKIAHKNNIIIVQNEPLARALYDNVEIGQFVPQELYQAVAEVLAYVYRISNKV
ncbi:MAG TPA: EscU/YscU/HrcU family type III secretion system export apparatus switch protein, partial [Oscillospiraceae bacterium]|nr:EscU/YscU/HrcU family type III secretion system export apparatus switch protein [Oscillospiraceae bacterium]